MRDLIKNNSKITAIVALCLDMTLAIFGLSGLSLKLWWHFIIAGIVLILIYFAVFFAVTICFQFYYKYFFKLNYQKDYLSSVNNLQEMCEKIESGEALLHNSTNQDFIALEKQYLLSLANQGCGKVHALLHDIDNKLLNCSQEDKIRLTQYDNYFVGVKGRLQ